MFQASKSILKRCIPKASLEHMLELCAIDGFCCARKVCLTFKLSDMSTKKLYRDAVLNKSLSPIQCHDSPVAEKKGGESKQHAFTKQKKIKQENHTTPKIPKPTHPTKPSYHITSIGEFIVNQAFEGHPSNWSVLIIPQAVVVHRK